MVRSVVLGDKLIHTWYSSIYPDEDASDEKALEVEMLFACPYCLKYTLNGAQALAHMVGTCAPYTATTPSIFPQWPQGPHTLWRGTFFLSSSAISAFMHLLLTLNFPSSVCVHSPNIHLGGSSINIRRIQSTKSTVVSTRLVTHSLNQYCVFILTLPTT